MRKPFTRWIAPLAILALALTACADGGPTEAADDLYEKLTAGGNSVLIDDRSESPGVKFKDADLLGMPVRATVSPRNLKENSIEIKRRTDTESAMVPVAEAPESIAAMLSPS